MDFGDYEGHLYRLWSSVQIERTSRFTLFTFGETELPYYLILSPETTGDMVTVKQGEIRITRPQIITPGNASPEFSNFFSEREEDGEGMLRFLLSRSAAFSNLKIDNTSRSSELVSDSVEEVVDKLNQRLNTDGAEGVAILTAPEPLGWMALMRYAAERVMVSTPGNLTELREKGFLDF